MRIGKGLKKHKSQLNCTRFRKSACVVDFSHFFKIDNGFHSKRWSDYIMKHLKRQIENNEWINSFYDKRNGYDLIYPDILSLRQNGFISESECQMVTSDNLSHQLLNYQKLGIEQPKLETPEAPLLKLTSQKNEEVNERRLMIIAIGIKVTILFVLLGVGFLIYWNQNILRRWLKQFLTFVSCFSLYIFNFLNL